MIDGLNWKRERNIGCTAASGAAEPLREKASDVRKTSAPMTTDASEGAGRLQGNDSSIQRYLCNASPPLPPRVAVKWPRIRDCWPIETRPVLNRDTVVTAGPRSVEAE